MSRLVSLALQSLVDPALADCGERIMWVSRHLGSGSTEPLDCVEIGFFYEDSDQVAKTVPHPAVLVVLEDMDTVSMHLARRTYGIGTSGRDRAPTGYSWKELTEALHRHPACDLLFDLAQNMFSGELEPLAHELCNFLRRRGIRLTPHGWDTSFTKGIVP